MPDDWFCWLEILSGDEADVLFADDGENSYAGGMDKTLKSLDFSDDDIIKVKIWWSSYPKDYNVDKGKVDPRRKVIQNDDHDTQYADYRGLTESGKGCVLTEGCDPEKHRAFEVALFEKPYDVADNANDAPIRMILSSFYTTYNGVRLEGLPANDAPIRMILSSFYTTYNGVRLEGLPDGLSDCEKACESDCDKCKDKSLPEIKAYLPEGTAYSGEGFTRVHRDPEIIAAMQKWME